MAGMLKLKNQLKDLLEKQGMTPSQLARKTGIPKQTISDWLSGGQPRQLHHLHKVARSLNTTIDELCFGDSSADDELRGSGGPTDILIGEDWVCGVFELKVRQLRQNKR